MTVRDTRASRSVAVNATRIGIDGWLCPDCRLPELRGVYAPEASLCQVCGAAVTSRFNGDRHGWRSLTGLEQLTHAVTGRI